MKKKQTKQTYVVRKQKSTMLFFGAKAGMCKNVHTQQDEENKALKDDSRQTHKETVSPHKHIREKDA